MTSSLRPPPAPPRAAVVGTLDDHDRADLLALVAADPIVNAAVAARLSGVAGVDARALGGAVVGSRDAGGELTGAVFDGGNLLPIGGGEPEWAALADHVVRGPRRATSVVGRREAVAAMWQRLEPLWGPARAVRRERPLLVLDRDPGPDATTGVRAIRPDELDAYLPAAAAMFTEELGISPWTFGGEFRARLAASIRAGRAFGVVDRAGEVVFKADLGAVSPRTCQVQGVWVRPDLRGQGFGTATLAGVLHHALTLAPSVSLYVNDFNTAARRMYATLGLRQVATLSTVLL